MKPDIAYAPVHHEEWRQVAENADSPLESAAFINHGTHIACGAPRRMGESAPSASEEALDGSWQGGNGPLSLLSIGEMQRRGLGSRFPPLVARSPRNRATSRENSPRIPPRDYLVER